MIRIYDVLIDEKLLIFLRQNSIVSNSNCKKCRIGKKSLKWVTLDPDTTSKVQFYPILRI